MFIDLEFIWNLLLDVFWDTLIGLKPFLINKCYIVWLYRQCIVLTVNKSYYSSNFVSKLILVVILPVTSQALSNSERSASARNPMTLSQFLPSSALRHPILISTNQRSCLALLVVFVSDIAIYWVRSFLQRWFFYAGENL